MLNKLFIFSVTVVGVSSYLMKHSEPDRVPFFEITREVFILALSVF